jgi:hypothetical protein
MEWQPIETAPKDGVIFIALSIKGVSRCRWIIVDYDEWRGRNFYWWDDPDENFMFEDGPHDAPTHWMPLPAPPTPSTAPAEASSESA